MAPLNGKQRRYLRSLGHHLDPVVHVGKEGISEGLLHAIDGALQQHELIKVRIGDGASADRRDIAGALAEASLSDLVGVVGKTLLLYRARPTEPTIRLPRQAAP